MQELVRGFTHLLFPKKCPACEQVIREAQHILCATCYLSEAQQLLFESNRQALTRLFKSSQNIKIQGSLLRFDKPETRKIIYTVKSQKSLELLKFFSKRLGHLLKEKALPKFDAAIAVPSSMTTLQKRGFNQSAEMVKTISKFMHIDYVEKALSKISTQKQQQKSKVQRLASYKDVFHLKNKSLLKAKNILLIDDVITTGSTIKKIAELFSNQTNIHAASLAYTPKYC